MKESGRMFLISGLFVLIAFVCTGCAKKYPACNDYEFFSDFNQLKIKRGSTIEIANNLISPAEEEAMGQQLKKWGLSPLLGYKKRSDRLSDIFRLYEGKKLSKEEKFKIYKENDVLDRRADYTISFAVHAIGSDDLRTHIVIKERTPDSKTLTPWQYFEYACSSRCNTYRESFPIACPIGPESTFKRCLPFATTKVLQVIHQHLE